ncbi:MAG: M48 family metalloprotease [Rhizobiaceae bacterium]|nr:M48 family metalloprotease [Rhizobiaceae bacterium]
MNAVIPPLSLLEGRRHRWLNTVHTWLLAGGSLLLLAVTAYVFAGFFGVIVAIVFGAFAVAGVLRISPQMVLSMYKAQPVSRAEFPAGVEMVEELARRAGLPAAPRLHIVPSNMLNAFAVGGKDNSAIAITDALARRLSARELAGVLAHEMSHIAHEDLKVMAFADVVSRYTSIMSSIGIFTLLLNLVGLAGGYSEPVPWLGVIVLIVAPTIGGLLQLALSRTREFDADLGAAMLTGDPDGLASALQKLEREQGRMWEQMMLPGGRNPHPSVLRTHPPTAQRVARLMQLKGSVGAVLPPDATILRPAALDRPPQHRRSSIPSIGGRSARTVRELETVARHLADAPRAGVADPGEEPASAVHIRLPEGKPRIRVRRGGVYW